jgi:hypothetical protein
MKGARHVHNQPDHFLLYGACDSDQFAAPVDVGPGSRITGGEQAGDFAGSPQSKWCWTARGWCRAPRSETPTPSALSREDQDYAADQDTDLLGRDRPRGVGLHGVTAPFGGQAAVADLGQSVVERIVHSGADLGGADPR